jgi:predicted unusual protein kinase regulating ubiquinone biosynthesis (AarF/ABC1/UbiB family)
MQMFLRDNYIHGDLHGGNLMAADDGMLTYAHVCSRMLRIRMLTYLMAADDGMPTYAHVCSRLLTYADVC